LNLGAAKGGRLAIVSGARQSPLVWASRLDQREGEPLRWLSTLAAPGAAPVELEGLIHDVASWQHGGVVAVGPDALHLFR
jgi:hypothetical protein